MGGLTRLGGVRPGVGTITHPVVVGLTVNAVLDLLPAPGSLLGASVGVGTPVVVLGVGPAAASLREWAAAGRMPVVLAPCARGW